MKYVLLAGVALIAPCAPALAQSEPLLGQIMIFGGNFCPHGWAKANGADLQISQNAALFSLLGTTYGGNGTTTFKLPDIAPMETKKNENLTMCIALQGVYPSRD
ncbi:MAG TPA: tail fiber protein [Acidisphaera sp.]|nr:tail fiber protein [Acidisphaera sp.]